MAHLVEAVRQMTGEAGDRQIAPPALALLHGDGGVLSSHVSLVLERPRMSADLLDWTDGTEALAFETCGACGTLRYFRRPFCPACGSEASRRAIASGRGIVYAMTTVIRAPSAELRALAPYGIALVDAEEGFRFMAHAADGLAIGDAVATALPAVRRRPSFPSVNRRRP